MEAYRQEIILGAVALYMVFCVITGLWAMRRTSDASDFFVAGRGLGPIVPFLFDTQRVWLRRWAGAGLFDRCQLFLDDHHFDGWLCARVFHGV